MAPKEANKAKRNGEEMEDSGDSISFIEVYRDLISSMEKRGYKIVPDMSGSFAAHRVYVLKKVRFAPSDKPVEYWSELVKPSNSNDMAEFNQDRQRFDNQVEGYFHMYLQTRTPDKESFKLIVNMQKGLQGIASPTANPMATFGKRDNDTTAYFRSLTGQRAFSQMPQLSWFPTLKDLSPYKLLGLFPKAEADLLMLTLGSMLTGNDQAKVLEGSIAHFMRTGIVMFGKEAQLGKSFLLSSIRSTLTELGYTSTTIGNANARFGWGEIAASDLSFRDDMNEKDQGQLLENAYIKSIISKGELSTERKGENQISTQARATIICCSNYYNKTQFLNADAGTLSRIRFLYTYNRAELKKLGILEEGQRAVDWQPQVKKYGVDTGTLACYLLAHCAARFLEATGYEIKHEQAVRTGTDKSLDMVSDLTKQLILKTDIKHVDDLVISVSHLVALAASKQRLSPAKMAAFLDTLRNKEFGYELLGSALRAYSVSSPNTDAEYIMKLHSDCHKTISKNEERWSNRGQKRTAPEAFEQQAKELLSKDNYKFPKACAYYDSVWMETRKNMEEYVELYKDFDFDELGDELPTILEEVWKTVKPSTK